MATNTTSPPGSGATPATPATPASDTRRPSTPPASAPSPAGSGLPGSSSTPGRSGAMADMANPSGTATGQGGGGSTDALKGQARDAAREAQAKASDVAADLKDTAGDSADGVLTLPVLLGLQRARQWILFVTTASYAGAALLLGAWTLLPLNLALLAWHLRELCRVPYVEARVFRVYLLGQAALLGALCLLSQFDIP